MRRDVSNKRERERGSSEAIKFFVHDQRDLFCGAWCVWFLGYAMLIDWEPGHAENLMTQYHSTDTRIGDFRVLTLVCTISCQGNMVWQLLTYRADSTTTRDGAKLFHTRRPKAVL